MPRRITVSTALAAVVAAGTVTASPADAAVPWRVPPPRADRFVLPTPRVPDHALQGGYSRDLLYRPTVPGHMSKPTLPGPPTWPVDPEPLTAPAESTPIEDGERAEWVLMGLGLVGAGIAAGGAAGVARRYRIRARRLAV